MKSSSFQLKQPDASSFVPKDKELWSDDKLDRKKSGERLANMIAGQTGPLTIGLNGRWGEGKTFFLKRFQKQYEIKGGHAVYFNAWQDDFLDDPLLSLVCQLRDTLEKLPNENLVNSINSMLVPALKHAGMSILKAAVKNTIKIDVDALSTNDLETAGETLFSEYEKACSSRNELIAALKAVAKDVKDQTEKPLVVIVDELDRCRPTFAIELFERIKHLFSVEHIVFILGIDRTQLESSIASVYGNIDIQGYLHRFIDVEFVLSNASLYEFIQNRLAESHIAAAIDPNTGMDAVNCFLPIFCAIADAEKLPPRSVEQALRKFALVSCARNRITRNWIVLSAYAIGLSMLQDKALFNRFMDGACEPKEIVDVLFPHFSIAYPYENEAGALVIRDLYNIYYHSMWNADKRRAFDSVLQTAKDEKTVDSTNLLPLFSINSSPRAILSFFSQIQRGDENWFDLKSQLADMKEAMTSIVDFS